MKPILALFLALPACADIHFTAKPMPETDAPKGKELCEIRLKVDEAVDVTLSGGRVDVHNVSGADAEDEGSACTAPLPERDFEGFQLKVKQKRGEVQLSQSPSRANRYKAEIFIRDSSPGASLYVLRLIWTRPAPAPPPGMSLNNTASSKGSGHGEARLDDEPALALTKAAVDYDNGGKLFVVLSPESGAPLSFGGSIMSFEGGVMKAEVAADERFDRLRGPMLLYFDGKRQVYKIELNATDGQKRLRVTWEKK